MRVALLSYPMLFQRTGGAQIQILETQAALKRRGVDAVLCDPVSQRLTDFDIVHVFCTDQGNYRIVEAAKAADRPVVLSSIFTMPWSHWDFRRGQIAEALTARLTRWRLHTTFHHFQTAVNLADELIALGKDERNLIVDKFGKPAEHVAIVPNGVSAPFFSPDVELAWRYLQDRTPFVLCVGSIQPYKGQHRLVEAIRGTGLKLVLAGPCAPQDRPYLDKCLQDGQGNVRYLATIAHDDELLPALFGAATVSALVSDGEASPITLVESLAAGTPFVLTRSNSVELERAPTLWREVTPGKVAELRSVLTEFAEAPKPQAGCRALVQGYTWDAVAARIVEIYERLATAGAA